MKSIQQHKWITFSLDGKELCAISIKGCCDEEIAATKELLAYENNVISSDIVVGAR